MRKPDDLFRGELKCAHKDCTFDGHIVTPGRNKTYKAWCSQHHPPKVWEKGVLISTCLAPHWDDVEEVTIHEMKPDADRRGDIISLKMKDVPNVELMLRHAVETLQYLIFMSNRRGTIHNLGADGEQSYCWVFQGYPWDKPATARITDKYWGDHDVENIRKIVRTMAQIHDWKVNDETIPLLDRFVQALGD